MAKSSYNLILRYADKALTGIGEVDNRRRDTEDECREANLETGWRIISNADDCQLGCAFVGDYTFSRGVPIIVDSNPVLSGQWGGGLG